MKRFFVLCLCAVLGCLSESLEKCNNKFTRDTRGIVNINGSFHYISPFEVNVEGAIKFCIDSGMKLISIQSQEKQQIIIDYFLSTGEEYYSESFWTSGFHLNTNSYIWSGTGEMFSYTNWHETQPSIITSVPHTCVYMLNGVYPNNTWWDDYCNDSLHYFICEEIDKFA